MASNWQRSSASFCGIAPLSVGLTSSSAACDPDLWADQLAALLHRLDAAPAYLCAASADWRVSYTTAPWYPQVVRGIYLWLVSGGPVAERLGAAYYGQCAQLAESRGMAAVAAEPYWAERIAAHPANRWRLLSQHPIQYNTVELQRIWRKVGQRFRDETSSAG